MHDLKYPIGAHIKPSTISDQRLLQCINDIAEFPKQITGLLHGTGQANLAHTYRPGGWTVKQIVHHCADSHMQAYTRCKLALTEDRPIIKPYDENRWTALSDVDNCDLDDSIIILRGLHSRWSNLLSNLSPEDLERCFVHPEMQREFSIRELTEFYSWHSRHHAAHVAQALRLKY